MSSQCRYLAPPWLRRNLRKHGREVRKTLDPQHRALIPLVEATLALMRLSCEKFFVLLSVYVSYLLFQDPPSLAARWLIRVNARYARPPIAFPRGTGWEVTI